MTARSGGRGMGFNGYKVSAELRCVSSSNYNIVSISEKVLLGP